MCSLTSEIITKGRDVSTAKGKIERSVAVPSTPTTEANDLEKRESINPRTFIPTAVQNYSTSERFAELVGRFLWFNTENVSGPNMNRTKLAPKYYEMIERAFPESIRMSLIATTLLIRNENDPNCAMVADRLESLRKTSASFATRFSLFQRRNLKYINFY